MIDVRIRKKAFLVFLAVVFAAASFSIYKVLSSAPAEVPFDAAVVSAVEEVKASALSPRVNPDSPYASRLAAVQDKLEGRLSDDDVGLLEARGVIRNTEKSLALLRRDPAVLILRNAILDARALKEEGRGLNVPERYRASSETRRHIVMFEGPVSQETKDALTAKGAQVEGYLPNRAVAVTAGASQLAAIKAMPDVVHIEPFHPYFKMSAEVQACLAGSREAAVREIAERGEYRLMLFQGGDAVKELQSMGLEVEKAGIGGHELAKIQCAETMLPDILKIDGVRWVEGKKIFHVMNDLADTTLRARPMKASMPGLDGSGVIIGVADSGIDFEHAAFSVDPNLPTSSNINTRIVDYIYLPGVTSDGVAGDNNGHGTHVSASILGNGGWSTNVILAPGSGAPPYTTNQFAGIAPKAKIVMLEDFNSLDATQVCWMAYQRGARISNNSWGANWPDYDTMSMQWDFLVRDANDDISDGLQPYICFFAAGNSGSGDTDGLNGFAGSVGMPANSKNVITVGALEQRRMADNLNQFPYDSILNTDSDWQIASYSSRGPTPDGRMKPDVVAPGSYVLSAQSQEVDFDNIPLPEGVDRDWHNNNLNTGPDYAVMSGTSMATPLTTGSGALFYQYYTNTFNKAPSPAMMKAALINGANLTHSLMYDQVPGSPIVYQGWGKVDLVRTIKGPGARGTDQVVMYDELDSISAVDEVITKTFVVADENEGGLKITLAWTDYPGTPGAGVVLVNDLDLVVRGPDGAIYQGNLMARIPWGNVSLDITDEDFFFPAFTNYAPALGDAVNNVEQVIVRHARKGTYTIEVRGLQIPQPSQTFALVVHKGVWSIGDSQGQQPALTLDGDGYPVLSTINWHNSPLGADESNVVGLRHWKGSFGESTEFGTWRILQDKWFDYGYGRIEQELISGYVLDSTVREPDVAVNPANGLVYNVWVHDSFETNKASCIYLRYTDGTNLYQLGGSYDTHYGICDSYITEDAFSPKVEIGSDGNPIVAYIQPILDIPARTFYQEVIVKRWNGSAWVSFDGSITGIVRKASYAVTLDMKMNGGVPVLLWHDLRDKVMRSYTWIGGSWRQLGADFGYRPVGDNRPGLTISGGRPYAAWSEYGIDSSRPEQSVRVAMFNGSSWVGLGSPTNSADYPGVSNTNYPGANPLIGSAGGRVYVAWQNGETNDNNTVNLKQWNGSVWSGINGSDSNSIINLNGIVTLKSMEVHPLGFPIIAFESTRAGGLTESMVVGLAADVSPPYFLGINYANGTLSNSVDTGWTEAFSGGQTMTYTVYRSPGNWSPADPALPPATDPATIAAVFANPVGSIPNANTLSFGGLAADRVWYWGVRVQNSSGVSDGNTKIILGGPTSATGDADNDWLTYAEEIALGTDPMNRDTDGDGMWDGWEFVYSSFNTGQVAGVAAHTNALSMDPFDNGTDDILTVTTNDGAAGQGPYDDLDGDGMSNLEEFTWWRNYYHPLGIAARTNMNNWLLDPTNPDSDGDGMPDGWEWVNNLNPGSAVNDGTTGPGDDPDGDGVTNIDEYLIGGDPWNSDSDQDGLTDLQEMLLGTRADNPDTDGDGLQDGFEIQPGVNGNPALADSNNNGVSDGEEYELGWHDVGDPGRELVTQLLYQDFESGAAPGWTTFSPDVDLWHITSADPNPPPATPIYMSSHTPNFSYRCANDPTRASTNGTYEVPGKLVYSALDSPVFDPASQGTINLFVSWKEWYSTESQWDLCQVMVSRDSGVTWNLARQSVSGNSDGWVTRVADISGYASDSTVKIRFLLRTLNSINNAFPGWYVDDIRVYGGAEAIGTVRDIDGRPIRNATVYAIGAGGLTNRINEHVYVNPGTVFASATTDDAGRYRIRGLYRGTYYIKATYPGYRSEFWNGDLYDTNPALQFFQLFGGQLNAGVQNRWQVTNPADLTLFNTTKQCDFELERGSSRGSLTVLSPATGLAVYLNQQSTNTMVWNGSTNAPQMNAYITTNAIINTRPDWYTNNLELTGIKPVMIDDIAEGDHVVYFEPAVWAAWPWSSRVNVSVRDGESTVVSIGTNFVESQLHVISPGSTNNIIVDRRDTGLQTTGTMEPVKIMVAQGEHEVILKPGGLNKWVPPKLANVLSASRAIVLFSTNEIYGARGSINVETVDLNGNAIEGASVWLDGYSIDAAISVEGTNGTPLTIPEVHEGDHYLTVYKDGYKYSPNQIASAYSNLTNYITVTLYEADRDYDYIGDAFEQKGYSNIFLYAGQDDTDEDGLLNQVEYDLWRIDGMNINLANPDSDGDMVLDGVEVGYDGISNRLAVSVLHANAQVGDGNVNVYFRGRFLEGINNFHTNMLAAPNGMPVSLEGDLCVATNMVWVGDLFDSPVMRFSVPRFGPNNRVVSSAHNFNTAIFADMIPDKVDTDGDGMWDGFEFIFEGVGGLNPIEAGATQNDPDNDGLVNIDEFLGFDRIANTNDWSYPNNPDSDGDGIPDGWEIEHGMNPRDPTDALLDVDNDGLNAYEEWENLTDPQNRDSDNDGLIDGLEVKKYFTDPLNPDTDGDGLTDGEEVIDTDSDPSNGLDGGFFPNWNGGDMDGDGLIDGPTDWDTDGDGMPDGFEVKDAWGNIRPPGQRLDPSDPTDGALDFDGDGLSNLQEYLVRDQMTGNPPGTFGYPALWDFSTDPFNADTDGDGMPDGFEVFNGLHPMDPISVGISGSTNTLLRYTDLWLYSDLDLDGVANINEYNVRFIQDESADPYQLQGSTHPWISDTDGDGLWDGEEFKAFTANPLSQDSDGDGLMDGSGIAGKLGEVDTEDILANAHFDQAFNDLWQLVLAPTLPYPIWVNIEPYTPVLAGVPAPRWGADLVHVNYTVRDDAQGNYVSRPVGGNKVPAGQELLANNSLVLIGGRDGVTQINDLWEYTGAEGWQNRGLLFPYLGANQGWSELSACSRRRPVNYKHAPPRAARPRPGGPPGYEFYTDVPDDDPEEIWGEEGVVNWDWNVFMFGWVRQSVPGPTTYRFSVDFDLDGTPDSVGGNRVYDDGGEPVFYPTFWKTRDNTNIVVRYGWGYIADAYERDNTLGPAYSQLDNEGAGEFGPYIKAGADATNRFYAGVTLGRVMNTATDYSGGLFPSVVNARLRMIYAATAPVTVSFVSELGRLFQASLPNVNPHNTLSAPDNYYTAAGQNPLYRPRERDVNIPKFPPSQWAFNSPTIGTAVFPAAPLIPVSIDIDVTAQFTEAMAANNNGAWEIGNNLGFLFFGSTNTPGFVYIAKGSQELFVDVTTPPYLQPGQWYPAPAVVPAPHQRKSTDMVYMPGQDQYMIFGGVDSVRALNDTWVAAGQAGPEALIAGWTQIDPALPAPPPRWSHSMLASGSTALMFGGFDKFNQPLNDLWQFNGAFWSEVIPVDGEVPQPRGGASFGQVGGFNLLYGGTDGEEYFNDLWVLTMPGMVATNSGGITNVYTETKWMLIQPNGFHSLGPAPRAFAATSHDMVIFGGRRGTIPSGTDTDKDGLSDGLEVELGPTSRDPRFSPLQGSAATSMSTGVMNDVYAYLYTPIGSAGFGGTPPVADFESLEFDANNAAYAAALFLPYEGWNRDDPPLVSPPGSGSGYWHGTPDSTDQWWHCFNRSIGTAGDVRDVWDLGCPQSKNAPAGYVPRNAYSGRWCWGTKLNGSYPSSAVMELYSPLMDFSGISSSNTLYMVFYEWLSLADQNDIVRIDAVIPTTASDIANRRPGALKPIVNILPARNSDNNTTGVWRRVEVALEPIANEPSFYFVFTLQSDSAGEAGGWYIDDVAIASGGRITGINTNSTAVHLFAEHGTNALQTVSAGPTGQFGFNFLPSGDYRLLAGDGSGVDVGIASGGGTWVVEVNEMQVNDIVLGIALNSPARISWNAEPGFIYEVQYTTPELLVTSNPWVTLSVETPLTKQGLYIDLDSEIEKSRFYRVIMTGVVP